jgi:phosphoribosylformylglycinamidine synthase
MSASPRIIILHASGANRDAEAARACTLAGGAPEVVHINQLRSGERNLAEFAALLLPGGFSYGDALGAGARLALDLQVYFRDALSDFVNVGRPVLGICNGFQTLVKAGIIPGGDPGARRVTLTGNQSGHFECRWIHLEPSPHTRCHWTHGMDQPICCPVAHGEGRVQVTDAQALAELERDGLIVFRYVDGQHHAASGRYPINPNGSAGDIAGLCNHAGNVVGLMPHPEDHVQSIQSPLPGSGGIGLALFQRFVAAAKQ